MKKIILVLIGLFAWASVAFAAVNINTATKAELESIKGIGPVKAQAIIDYRAKYGGFKSVDDLDKVTGIGKATLEKIRGDVTLSGYVAKPSVAPATAATPAKPAIPATMASPAKPTAPTPAVAAKPAVPVTPAVPAPALKKETAKAKESAKADAGKDKKVQDKKEDKSKKDDKKDDAKAKAKKKDKRKEAQ